MKKENDEIISNDKTVSCDVIAKFINSAYEHELQQYHVDKINDHLGQISNPYASTGYDTWGNHKHTISHRGWSSGEHSHNMYVAPKPEKNIPDFNSVVMETFPPTEVDVESLTLKEIYDGIVAKNPSYIEYVPQTPERCVLALEKEWTKSTFYKIKIPITGYIFREMKKMKLLYGPMGE